MKRHPDRVVSWIKGALAASMQPKQIARYTGIPVETIREWSSGEARGDVQSNKDFAPALAALLQKFDGSPDKR